MSKAGRLVALAALVAAAGCAEGSTVDETGTEPTDGGSDPCVQDPDLSSHGNSCEDAVFLGTLSDAAGDQQMVTGNAVIGADVWWSFAAPDDTDTAGDEYHVDVRFATNPGRGYAMDVFRDGCTADAQVATGEQDEFDWYTDFAATDAGCTVKAPCGEGDCAPEPGEEGKNTCGDDSATFYIRVFRPDGATSCVRYELEVSNGYYASN